MKQAVFSLSLCRFAAGALFGLITLATWSVSARAQVPLEDPVGGSYEEQVLDLIRSASDQAEAAGNRRAAVVYGDLAGRYRLRSIYHLNWDVDTTWYQHELPNRDRRSVIQERGPHGLIQVGYEHFRGRVVLDGTPGGVGTVVLPDLKTNGMDFAWGGRWRFLRWGVQSGFQRGSVEPHPRVKAWRLGVTTGVEARLGEGRRGPVLIIHPNVTAGWVSIGVEQRRSIYERHGATFVSPGIDLEVPLSGAVSIDVGARFRSARVWSGWSLVASFGLGDMS